MSGVAGMFLWVVLLPAGLSAQSPRPLLYVQQGPEAVTKLAVSPDGKLLATDDGVTGRHDEIALYELPAGREIGRLHHAQVQAIAFSPDGQWLATAGREDRQELVKNEYFSFLATVYSIRLWRVADGTLARVFWKGENEVRALAFAPDGQTLATGDSTPTLKLWEVNAAAPVPRVVKTGGSLTFLCFASDGKALAGVTYSGQVTLWDWRAGAELRALTPAHTGRVKALAFSPDGKLLASGAADKSVRLWQTDTGALAREFVNLPKGVDALAFTDQGATLTASIGGKLKRWQTSDGQPRPAPETEVPDLGVSQFTPGGRTLISGGYKEIALADAATAAPLKDIKRAASVCYASVSRDGDDQLLWLEATGNNSKLWDFRTGEYLGALDSAAHCPDFSNYGFASFSPDAQTAAVANTEKKGVNLFDRKSDQLRRTLATGQDYLVAPFYFSPDGKLLAAVGFDGVTKLFETATGRALGVINTNPPPEKLKPPVPGVTVSDPGAIFPHPLRAPAFAPDGKTLAGAFSDKEGADALALWSVNGGRETRRLARQEQEFTALAFAPDGGLLAAADKGGRGQFERVETVTLLDGEATKANILREVQKLVAASQPKDGALIYFSGHGTAQGNRFYLIPHDLGYAGPRCVNTDGLALLLAHSISDEELETAVRGLDANQLLLVVDACNSGQALNADDKRRGPMNARGLAQLAYEKGMSVLTASQDVEEAFVSNQLRHSYLTYALVEEGLKARAADTRPADGTVSLHEWFDYAARRVPKLRGEKLQGKDITEEGGDAPAGQPATRPTRTQTPRVFYRREPLYARPLVMARQP